MILYLILHAILGSLAVWLIYRIIPRSLEWTDYVVLAVTFLLWPCGLLGGILLNREFGKSCQCGKAHP